MFFFPKIVETKRSEFNGLIKVYKLFGKHSLSVDNLTQSGGLVKSIWKKALNRAKSYKLKAKSCLILGFGGGTAANFVHQYWPKAKITGIEIDPVMVKLGKKYFDLGRMKNLKIITSNVFKLISHQDLRSKNYDLVLVDLYQGKQFPTQANSTKFLKDIKALLAKNGIAIINRLNYGQNKNDIHRFIAKTKKIFPQVTHQKILSNILVFCFNSG